MAIGGVPGSKVFWLDEDEFFFTEGRQCRGCGSHLAARLALRAIYETRKDALVFGRSCGGGRSELQTGGRIALDGSGMLGIELGLRLRGVTDRPLVVISGDGRTLDMGFGDFVSAFDREQKVTFIILDNQAQASSGSHRTATTPLKAQTRIYTKGVPWSERNIPLMMVFDKARYVATATPAYVKDYVAKVQKALQSTPSFIQVLSPCQVSWRYSPEQCVTVSRLAVQTGMFPLWEYENGALKRTVKVPKDARVPLTEYTSRQGRYSRLSKEDILLLEEHIEQLNSTIDVMQDTLTGKV